jgi:hypothetical protein
MNKPLFALGQVLATPGVLAAMREANDEPTLYLMRHQSGDWGDLGEEDRAENDFSLNRGLRLLSAYHLLDGTKVWIISEADRSATTVLLPSEY